MVPSSHSLLLLLCPALCHHKDFLSFTTSWSLLRLMSNELLMLSNHFILCYPLLLQPSVILWFVHYFIHQLIQTYVLNIMSKHRIICEKKGKKTSCLFSGCLLYGGERGQHLLYNTVRSGSPRLSAVLREQGESNSEASTGGTGEGSQGSSEGREELGVWKHSVSKCTCKGVEATEHGLLKTASTARVSENEAFGCGQAGRSWVVEDPYARG